MNYGLEQAQELATVAFEIPEPEERVRMARRALKLSELCADAYVILARDAATELGEARYFWERALAAAEAVLGKGMFLEAEGSFWELDQTRPYMRARIGLATNLRALGNSEASVSHAGEMLRLNPADHQGARYWLVSWLIEDGRLGEAKVLLSDYEGDPSVHWAYSNLLLSLAEDVPREDAVQEKFRMALRVNPFVPAQLLGEELPADVGPEDLIVRADAAAEAAEYSVFGSNAWRARPDAISRLKELRDHDPPDV